MPTVGACIKTQVGASRRTTRWIIATSIHASLLAVDRS